jgi:DNA-binding response OmpR family regulator
MCNLPPPRRPCVLLVADGPGLRSVLSALLRMEGFAPLQAENVHTALVALSDSGGEVDASLIYLQGPGQDAAAACQALREARPGLPCWLLAPAGSPPLPGGFRGRLAKPFTLGQLRACLAEVRAASRRRAAQTCPAALGRPVGEPSSGGQAARA